MLKRAGILLGYLLVVGLAVAAPPSREPANLDRLKAEIVTYVESGGYDADVAAVAAEAKSWIEARAKQGGQGLTVVFDLDETLLSNWPHMKAMSFAYLPDAWEAWVKSAQAPAIEPVREVYRAARKLGLDVVFLTGRRERDRPGTEKNLQAIGCGDYTALLCKPDAAKETAEKFKTEARAKLEADGRTVIANLGDQASDLAGGHAEKAFKLPCPFYLTN
ncbi:MAG: acid phosphatase [Verrucomicrobia bacterium]|nr:acid phosphatase [Verrucomicrobiota bacterium]